MKTYLIVTPDLMYLKIGKSADLKKRLMQLNTSSPEKLRLWGYFDGDIEDNLHKKFEKHRVNGEWFVFKDIKDELDTLNYTPIYGPLSVFIASFNLSKLLVNVSSITSIRLLFWLGANNVVGNVGINTNISVYKRFNNFLKNPIGYRTYNNSIKELVNAKLLIKKGRGQYYFNPHIFWKHDKKNRLDFIQAEVLDGKRISHNPTGTKQIEEQ